MEAVDSKANCEKPKEAEQHERKARLHYLSFADDTTLLAKSKSALKKMLADIETASMYMIQAQEGAGRVGISSRDGRLSSLAPSVVLRASALSLSLDVFGYFRNIIELPWACL